jgi:hypothetical protein
MVRLKRRLPSDVGEVPLFARRRALAIWSLVLWFGAISAGRLIAYTAVYPMYP